jgi:plastocyanin/mono/diheme cytochrome c family protein
MNTSKQINAMIAMLLLLLLGVGVYTIWDPFRATAKTDQTKEQLADYAAARFARNCRQCHGNEGEGRTGLGPPLNPEYRDSSGLPVFDDPSKLDEEQKLVLNTINCGRVGTYMPAWSQDQGGNLSAEQIRQLVLLITQPPPDGWKKVAEETAIENQTVPLMPVADIQASSPITGSSQRVCGQKAPATPPPPSGPLEVKTEWTEVTTDNVFSVTRMGVPAGQQVTLTQQNNGQALHNWALQGVTNTNGQPIKTQIIPGGKTDTITFTLTAPGTFNFICEVHPTEMKGTLEVQAAGAAAATPGPTPAAAVTTTPVAGQPSPTPSPSPQP